MMYAFPFRSASSTTAMGFAGSNSPADTPKSIRSPGSGVMNKNCVPFSPRGPRFIERPVTAGMLWAQMPDTPVSAAEKVQLAENREPVSGTTWSPVAVVAKVSMSGGAVY